MISVNSLWRYNDDENALEFVDSGDILSDYQEVFKSQFPDISMEPNTPQGQWCSFLAELDTATIKAYADIANFQFNGGSGEFLDFWAWNKFRAVRKKAILGTATITVQGVAGTEIQAGFIVSDGSQKFATGEDYIIGDNGTIDILVTQTELSEDVALANTITQQVTPIVGVETVTNPASSTAGIAKETDTQLRERCYKYNSLYKNSSFRSVLANLAQVSGVSKITGYENPTGGSVEFKGVLFNAHTIAVVLIGGDDDEIAMTMKKCKAVGCGTQGTTQVIITDERTQNNEIYAFYRATPAPLEFSVECRLHSTSPSAYMQMIQDSISLFVNNLEIGAYITQSQVAQAVEEYISGFEISDLKIARKNQTLGYSAITLNFTENATISNDDISINYVLV